MPIDVILTCEGLNRLVVLDPNDQDAYKKLEKCARELLPSTLHRKEFRVTYMRRGARFVVLDNYDFLPATKVPLITGQECYEFTVVVSGGANEPQNISGT
jgi:hypothetical protein